MSATRGGPRRTSPSTRTASPRREAPPVRGSRRGHPAGTSREPSTPAADQAASLPELEPWLAAELHQKAARHRRADAKRRMQEVLAAVEAGDPDRAIAAAAKAKSVAPHSPSVREALGLLHYAAEDFKPALAELQAFRRMTGGRSHDPRIADCYRALGRPERAIEVLETLRSGEVDEETWIDALIVRAEATAETGNLDGAVAILASGPLETGEVHDRHRRLWYAYAEVLERAGRASEARTWFRRLAVDDPEFSDAPERAGA